MDEVTKHNIQSEVPRCMICIYADRTVSVGANLEGINVIGWKSGDKLLVGRD